MKRVLLVIVALLVVTGLVLTFAKRPEPLDPALESAKRLHDGPHTVAYYDVTLTDTTRPSQAHGNFEGSDSRELKTRIWYPSDLLREGRPAAKPLPLLIYSHGFMSMRTGGAYLAEHMVSKGYIVAAMDYPLTNYSAPDQPYVVDVVNQPGDVSFLLDHFTSWHRDQGNLFEGAVDETRIGAFGLSLGGMTTTMAAFHPRFRDPRIDAAVSIAGPSFPFTELFYSHRQLPYMMIASPIDALVDYRANALPTLLVPGAILVTIEDASHTGFADMAKMLRFMRNPDKLGCDQVKSNIDASSEDTWYHLIGTPEEGVAAIDAPPLCEMDPLPVGMNPVRQHWLNQLAVSSFFESHFAEDPAVRRGNRDFLLNTLPREIAEVRVDVNNN
ncbi:alpha/beta hydrolase family protein [Litorivivens sp.]|uniref:alpha/beta hydrolase family protein n=1 Tax=Litorivivens sp. TaxID=2020868 RepID=UPI0035641F6E